MPKRFGNETHIVLEKLGTELADNQVFEPDMSKYVYHSDKSWPAVHRTEYAAAFQPRYRPKRNTNGNKNSIPDVLHIETAIFVDKGKVLLYLVHADLWRHLSCNKFSIL